MDFREGELVYLRYIGDPGVVHTRLLLGHIEGDEWMICTPDRDMYVEELHNRNADLAHLWHSPDGRVPRGVPAAHVYAFAPMSAAEYSRIVRDGRVEAAAERARRGVHVGAPVAQENAAAGPAGAAAVAAAAPGAMVPAGPLQPGGEAVYDPDTLYWLAAESLEGVGFGDAIPGVIAAAVAGAKAVHTFPSGRAVFVECVYGRDREQFLLRPGGWDFRCTPISLDSLGRPEVSLKDAAQKSFQKHVRWTMTGPRTTKWCLNYLVVEGLGLEGHHERVRTLCKLDSASWGMQEHFQVSMFLRYCLQIDQLNSHNLMAVEAMFRRLQTIEFGYSEKVREVEAKGTGGRLAMEEQQVFGGLTRHASTLMVCPDLFFGLR